MTSANGARTRSLVGGELSSAALFTLIWDALADLLGSAATATLLRRAARRARAHDQELAEVTIVRENLQYRYTLPPTWNDASAGTRRTLRCLVGELLPLLVELTGPVVVSRLSLVPELRERGIIPPQEEGP